jgi:hypothetical protein
MNKSISCVLVLFVSLTLLSLVDSRSAFAGYGGGGRDGAKDSTLSDFETKSEVKVIILSTEKIDLSRIRDNPSKVTLTKYKHSQFGNKVVKSNWQTALEWVESIGDLSASGTQGGIWVYAVYCWYVGEAVVLIPVAICWHGPKHLTRTIYGLKTGNLDTVHEVNEKSIGGRIFNRLVIEGLINAQRGGKGLPPKYLGGPTRSHPPEKDIIYFRGVK